MRVVASFDPSVTSTIPAGSLAGQTGGTFDLKQTGRVNFKIKNDSNISIHCYFPNGSDTVVVAGEEMLFCLDLPTSIVNWLQDIALNVNGAPLVSKVYVTIYDQTDREQGTYPFHITRLTNLGSTVPIATSANVSTLSNESSAPTPVLVIDIGNTTVTNLIKIFNDGSFIWQILVSGVAHTLMQGTTTADFLKLGQVGDEVNVVDKLRVSGTAKFAGNVDVTPGNNVILANNHNLDWVDSGGTTRTTMFVDTNDQVQISGNAGPGSGHGAVVTNSDTVAVWKILQGSQGVQLLNGTLNYIHGSISGIDGGQSNCGNGTTISHGLGVAPQKLVGTPWIAQPGSATVGMQNATSTTFQATVGAGTQISWIAMSP